MKHYSSAYVKGRPQDFMSLFSKSVVENNRLHYNEVREAYRETFSEKINSYRLNNMTIIDKRADRNRIRVLRPEQVCVG